MSTKAVVTVAIPVYKRLDLLPTALRSVQEQDYGSIDLLVSDNGNLGEALDQLVAQHYSRPFRIRRNATSVPVVAHFNQLLNEARGKYFVLLCDDDEISPDFVSDLAGRLEAHPDANVAVPKPASFDAAGNVRHYPGDWPERLRGDEFIRSWASKRIRLISTVTVMARTDVARARGGYLDLPRALYSDNVLLLRLALDSHVVFARHAVFRWRIDDASTGFSAPYREVAAACRGFFHYLDTDAQLRAFADAHPLEWRELRSILRDQCARWFFFRWKERYWPQLGLAQGLLAACSLPPIRSYYALVVEELMNDARAHAHDLLHRTKRA